MSSPDNKYSVTIVGGGLVGALSAVTLAQRGWQVDLYELRQDMRGAATEANRSINLALSERGIRALKLAGAYDLIAPTLIPMKGRMLHLEGQVKPTVQLYGSFGEAINSVERGFMNDTLLDMAEKLPNVNIHFSHSLVSCDLESGVAIFLDVEGERTSKKSDLIIGCDGVYSKMRTILQRHKRINFQQEYIPHAWLELNIPPDANGNAVMETGHLHIWPRNTFMMIALPNRDNSFTVTLFMPFEKFEVLTTREELLVFFHATFPDSVSLMGEDALVKSFFENPRGSLMSIKCKPYHYTHRALIVGDAAHAMVPFYGQGMNSGFEDVSTLSDILDKYLSNSSLPTSSEIAEALDEYSESRWLDVHSMCDLALHNYEEMRDSVTKPGYRLRKYVMGCVQYLFPKSVIPLYTMVSFTSIKYSEVVRRWKRQGFWLGVAGWALGGSVGVGIAAVGLKLFRK